MLTNRLNVKYNMKKIDADFDIFRVEKCNKDYYKCNVLDSVNYDFNALAVQWSFGTIAYVLFKKGEVTERKFKDSLMSEYKDLKVQKIDLLNEEECKQNFHYKYRLLAQLLVNSIKAPKLEGFTYNNLTGKLYYCDPSWKVKDKVNGGYSYIRFLEIVLNPKMYLSLEHTTFKRCKENYGSGLYVIDADTGFFRKKLKSDTNVVCYKKGSMKNKHFTLTDLNINDYAHFKKSKMGIMVQFLNDVKEELSNYITLEISEKAETQQYEISSLEKKGISNTTYGEMLRKKGVVIVDENNTKLSKKKIQDLLYELKTYYFVDAEVGEISKDKYNIRIIHNGDFYKENNIIDPHNDDIRGYIVQHIVEEENHFTSGTGASPAVKKVIQELLIKGDVRNSQISIFDWKKLNASKDWTFVLRTKVISDSRKDDVHYNFAGSKAFDYYNYYIMKITSEGELQFDNFCDSDDYLDEDCKKICIVYDTAQKDNFGAKNSVEGLVFSDIDNIQVILSTKERTLPDIFNIAEALQNTDPRQLVETKAVLKALTDFESKFEILPNCVFSWKQQLQNEEQLISKDRVKKILDMRKNRKVASMFNRFLHDKYDMWICSEMRSNDFEPNYQIGNILNIKYSYFPGNTIEKESFEYCVGTKSKKRTYPNSCIVRKVVTYGDFLEFEELLPLMSVDFVRNNQYTVLPFPFKYLREYIAQIK